MIKSTTVDAFETEKFAKLTEEWWDTDGALKTLHDINPARLNFIEMHVELPGKTVLDLGCGGGILTESLAQKAFKVVGVDAEAKCINAAKAHAHLQGLNIEYLCCAVETLQHPPFDVVCCMEMLEHVSCPQTVLHHCKRLLKPGGWLFLSTINRTIKAYMGAIAAAEYLFQWLPRQTHDYKKFIQPSELASMLRAESLSLVALQGMRYNPFIRTAYLCSDVSINYLVAGQN